MVLGKIDLKKCCCKNTLKYCFTYNIVNYSNSNGTITSPTASIISSRSNSNYPSKNYLRGVVSPHDDTKGGKDFPVSTIAFMSGGTVQIRVISFGSNNYNYVSGDFYYLP